MPLATTWMNFEGILLSERAEGRKRKREGKREKGKEGKKEDRKKARRQRREGPTAVEGWSLQGSPGGTWLLGPLENQQCSEDSETDQAV